MPRLTSLASSGSLNSLFLTQVSHPDNCPKPNLHVVSLSVCGPSTLEGGSVTSEAEDSTARHPDFLEQRGRPPWRKALESVGLVLNAASSAL